MIPKGFPPGTGLIFGNDVTHQFFFVYHHQAVVNAGQGFQGVLNFTQLNAQPPQFDLKILTPDVLNVTVGQHPPEIAGTIQFAGTELRFNEHLLSQFIAIDITQPDTGAGYADFTHHPGHHLLQVMVENPQLCVGNGFPHGNHLIGAVNDIQDMTGNHVSAFSGAIAIHQLHLGVGAGEPVIEWSKANGLTTQHQITHAGQGFVPIGCSQLGNGVERRRCAVYPGHLVLANQGQQFMFVVQFHAWHDDSRPRQQRGKQVLLAEVESHRTDHQGSIPGG